jgi:TetR/AcrR family transcriptional regulator, copper-responsive repressor
MVQKEEKRRLGRPRQYDPQNALQRAAEAFWDGGFSGTSLDDLSARTGLNRPSLYAAFGDKEALYLKTLKTYMQGRRDIIGAALKADRPLRQTLGDIYDRMIDRFVEGDHGARGCYLVGTAATEAVQNPKVREVLKGSLDELDGAFQAAFSAAQTRGELNKQTDPRGLAMMASAVVHTLAFRARSGQPRAALRALAHAAIELIFASGQAPKRKSRRR